MYQVPDLHFSTDLTFLRNLLMSIEIGYIGQHVFYIRTENNMRHFLLELSHSTYFKYSRNSAK